MSGLAKASEGLKKGYDIPCDLIVPRLSKIAISPARVIQYRWCPLLSDCAIFCAAVGIQTFSAIVCLKQAVSGVCM